MNELNKEEQKTMAEISQPAIDTAAEAASVAPNPEGNPVTAEYQPLPGSQSLPYSASQPAQEKHENIIAGIVGSFLFSLVGGLLYFIVYQFGFIAGICGLVTVVLAGIGYRKFSGSDSVKGVVISVIISLLVIFLSEYLCVSYEIYNAFNSEFDITFFDAVRATPDFLSEPEIKSAMIKDLLISYALGIIAAFGTIRQSLSGKK